eukprot:TRINITY_DN57_c0_g2_i1.p1 TRINITY_DN57_c0_g2~~TRINITY_DN57_c0_g2_i1.p1  ORF type:complete len:787 (-),score=289.88 TRINITY_DN57_c0_g2_i1:324-2684(-)
MSQSERGSKSRRRSKKKREGQQRQSGESAASFAVMYTPCTRALRSLQTAAAVPRASFSTSSLTSTPSRSETLKELKAQFGLKKDDDHHDHHHPEYKISTEAPGENPYFPTALREKLAKPGPARNANAAGQVGTFTVGNTPQGMPSEADIEAHLGHLNAPENALNDNDTFELNALNNVDVLKCLAEFNSSEFGFDFTIFPKQDAVMLRELYVKQLVTFEDETLPKLKAAKVPQVTQTLLSDIYKFRAATPVGQLYNTLLSLNLGAGKLFNSKAPPAVNQEYSRTKNFYSVGRTLTQTFFFQQTKMSKPVPIDTAIYQFKGFKALLNALARAPKDPKDEKDLGGLTPEEAQHIYAVLSLAATGVMEDAAPQGFYEISDQKVIDACAPFFTIDNVKDLEAAAAAVYKANKPLVGLKAQDIRPYITQQYFLASNELHLKKWREEKATHATREITEVVSTNTKQATKIPIDLSPERIQVIRAHTLSVLKDAQKADPDNKEEKSQHIAAVHRVVDAFTEPEISSMFKLTQLLAQAGPNLTEQLKVELVKPFLEADPQNDLSDDLVKDIVTTHPIPEILFSKRLDFLARDNKEYTQYYQEGAESLYKVRDPKDLEKPLNRNHTIKVYPEDPDFEEVSSPSEAWSKLGHPLAYALKKGKKGELEPVREFEAPEINGMFPTGYPFNAAIEHVQHLRLEALATNYLGFDLNNETDYMMFENYCHSYDISAGEDTLDRCFSYPPPEHTFDELPIMKKAGWEECDVPSDYPEYAEELAMDKAAAAVAADAGEAKEAEK